MKKQINKWHLMLLTFCVLLITILASIFDLNATTPVSTDDEESTVDNWEISIVFYDPTVGNGKTPLTEYNWNSVKHDEIRDIIIQINYKNTNTVTSYKANDLKILIPKLQSYNGYLNVYDITAGSLENEYNWKFSYSGNNVYLQNNLPIEEKTNLEGSIQLSFRPTPIQLANNTSQEFKATLSDKKGVLAESNTITFNYTSERKGHTVTKTANKVQGYDRMPEGADNYIWIRWHIDVLPDTNGVRSVYVSNNNYYRKAPDGLENSVYFIEHVPVDAIVLDGNMNIVENNNGEARIDTLTHGWYYFEVTYRIQTDIYIGYPKETYQNKKIENTIDVYGIYWDETEHSYLCSDTKSVNAADYAFTGYGRLYWHSKGNSGIIS